MMHNSIISVFFIFANAKIACIVAYMEYPVFDTIIQNEALINEFKGNLFEYLVGFFIARKYKLEKLFVDSFNSNFKEQLQRYELWLRKNEKSLALALPKWAEMAADCILDRVTSRIDGLAVVGKLAANPARSDQFEADLLLHSASGKIPVSIKLSKENSFVNTKSGGASSFLTKYFSQFATAEKWQRQLSDVINESFVRMGHQLYEMVDLEFCGKFDEQWIQHDLPELPGKLDEPMRQVVLTRYYEIISKIYDAFVDFYRENLKEFKRALFSLMGLGDPDIIQVTCFTKKTELTEIVISDVQKFSQELEDIKILPLKSELSSFEIQLKSTVLQIRVKPMNKFTVPAPKINCSIKKR